MCASAAIWKDKQHSQNKDPQNMRGIQKRRKDGEDQRLSCIAAHPPIHLHQYFSSLISWVRYNLSLRTTSHITANDIYIRCLY